MIHPSIEGLREAGAEVECRANCRGPYLTETHHKQAHIATAQRVLDAQAAYLTEHGVGWFGEGLVRARPAGHKVSPVGVPTERYVLVPVPQDGEGA